MEILLGKLILIIEDLVLFNNNELDYYMYYYLNIE